MVKRNKTHERKNGHEISKKSLGISKIILAILFEVGEITVKSFFPHPYSHLFCKHPNNRNLYSTTHRLKKQGLITKTSDTFRLTKKGEKEAFFAHLDAQAAMHQPNRAWDGHWRIVIFDVPEKKRKYRDYLRSMLKTLEFKELQKSIWVTPYQIPKFLEELLWEERIKNFTRFITIKEIDYDKDLRRLFKLTD